MIAVRNLLTIPILLIAQSLFAGNHFDYNQQESDLFTEYFNYRSDCEPPLSRAELNINNVRAQLYSGRAKWYRFGANNRGYQVPNLPGPGNSHSIFNGSTIKIGAFDQESNLKMAMTSYSPRNSVFFRPGPLSQIDGGTSAGICRDWDRFFEVRNEDIEIQRQNIEIFVKNGQTIPYDLIPYRIKYWPGMGNPFFSEKFNFELPDYSQGMAPFFDNQGNGLYHPEQGDFPVIGNKNCANEYNSRVPDQMFWWVTNDAGFASLPSWSQPMKIELHHQAFAFKSDVELNDMTFYRYRMINRGPLILDSLYFGVLTYPELSCPVSSDYFGSYPELDMMYVYQNFNINDPCSCPSAAGPIPTYCDHFPSASISFLDGLEDQNGDRLGMSVFMYYHIQGGFLGMTTPSTLIENYRYLTGSWRDGRPLTFGGNGFDDLNGERVFHAFPGNPRNDIWTYCTTNLPIDGKRVIMSSGPARLSPGGVNDLTMSVSWVPDVDYICPDLSRLFYTTKRTRELFNNCFIDENMGPDAPNLDFVSFNRSFIIFLDSDFEGSNNEHHTYRERGAFFPEGVDDPYYHFEGYLVFQLRDENVEPSLENLYDPYLARLVFQSDIENEVGDIYNWNPIQNPNPLGRRIFRPQLMVEAENAGIETSFRLFEDAFAEEGDRRFVPGREYYFTAIAYAHNNYEDFNWREPEIGQRFPFLASTRNIKVYSFPMSNSIEDDSPFVLQDVALESSQNDNQLGLHILENPGRDQLRYVVQSSRESLFDLKVFSINGRSMYFNRVGSGHGIINASNWPPGLYFVRLYDVVNSDAVVEKWIRL